MGKNGKRREENSDWDEIAAANSHQSGVVAHNESHRGTASGSRRGNGQDDANNSENLEDQGSQTDQDFGLYIKALEDLGSDMAASQKSIQNVHDLCGKQKRDIQDVAKTRQRLSKMTKRCNEYEATIKTLQNMEKNKDEVLAEQIAHIEEERNVLVRAVEAAAKDKKQLEDKKEKFDERVRVTELEQQANLANQKMDLEKKYNEQYTRCVEELEMKTKERQDGDRRRMADLEAKNKKLEQEVEEQKTKLRKAESRCKDTEKLKTAYEGDAESLREELKVMENEFGLNVGTNEFYKERFLKIHNDTQEISSRYGKEPHLDDLNTIRHKITEVDEEFISVPISTSEISEKLRAAHTQRVIAAQLQKIIWQPFSSEITLQDPKYHLLFKQVSEGLIKHYGGLRAARLYTALSMIGLQSRPQVVPSSSTSSSSAPTRADTFVDKVMAVLSILVKPSQHQNLRSNLLDLAKSASSVWNLAQTDEREFIAYPTLDPEKFDGWSEDTSATSEVIVLFPRIVAKSCPRVAGARHIGPPGMWIDTEPESHVEETCVHDGTGLAKWSRLVLEGEEEEEERREEEDSKYREEKRRELEETLKSLAKPPMGNKRRGSQSKRDSISESRLSPTLEWMKGGGQKIPEGMD